MKIVQIMAGSGNGGLENHFVDLSNGLADMGAEVVAISHPKYAERFSSSVRHIPLDLTKSRYNLGNLLKLAAILRREQADIIHSQANKATELVATIKRFIPGKTVATIHNRKKSTGMFTAMDSLIGVSNGTVKNLQHPDTHVVYNGLQPYAGKTLTRQQLIDKYQLNPSLPLCIAVGRLVPAKAFDDLLSAWQNQFGQLVIFGDGPDRADLERQIEELKLAESVTLAGHYNNLREVLSAADLLVISSRREGFCYVMVEALLAELPMVATRVPGTEDVLPEKYLVDPGDIAGLREKIATYAVDASSLKSEMAPLFEWARDNLSLANMVKQTYEVYLHTLSTNR